MKAILSLSLFCVLYLGTFGQPPLKHHHDIPVLERGATKLFPWAGGLSNPVFSESDFNNDGIQDLYVYDINGQKSMAFIHDGKNGIEGYHYAPKFDTIFPDGMFGWALMRDFNNDGAGDLFYYKPPFIAVQKGVRDGNGELRFEPYLPSVKFYNSVWQGIAGSAAYIPAIDDFNSDGKIDILNWDQQGSFIWLYQNIRPDTGQGSDSIYFDDITHCWGRVQDDKLNPKVNLGVVCKNKRGASPRHLGWTTMSFDVDGDLDKELLIGDSGYGNMIYLENAGDTGFANVNYQDTLWPILDKKVDMPIWPGAYHIDIDHDNLKDILVAPAHVSNGVDGSVDTNNVWYYKNVGTAQAHDYNFQQDDLFTSDMADFGTGAFPAIVDVNADGLLDIVVGNVGYFKGDLYLEAKLGLLINTGSLNAPSFDLVDRNWLDLPNIDTLAVQHAAPTFGDVDQDGDMDMLLGEVLGTLWFFENNAGKGNPMSFNAPIKNYGGLDVGLYSTPQLYHLNGDTLIDLVVGEEKGHIKYYENTGTPGSPIFTLKEDTLGELHVRQQYPNPYSDGHAAPHFCKLDTSSKLYLLIGSMEGRVHLYDSILGNLNGPFRRMDTTYLDLDEGSWTAPAAADFDGDGIAEVVVGNRRGGLSFFGLPRAKSFFTTDDYCEHEPVNIFDNSSCADSVSYLYFDSSMNLIDSTADVSSYTFPDANDYFIEQIAYSQKGNDTTLRRIGFESGKAKGSMTFKLSFSDVLKIYVTDTNTSKFYYHHGDGKIDTSTVDSSVHVYDTSGTFNVMVVLVSDCGNDTLNDQVTIINVPEVEQIPQLNASIIPNPGDGNSNLMIESSCKSCKLNISLRNIEGRLISSEVVNLEGRTSLIQLPRLEHEGIYLVQITSETNTLTLKYVVH